jgi:hypothetical protein
MTQQAEFPQQSKRTIRRAFEVFEIELPFLSYRVRRAATVFFYYRAAEAIIDNDARKEERIA